MNGTPVWSGNNFDLLCMNEAEPNGLAQSEKEFSLMKRISKDDQLAMEELIGLWKLPLFRYFLRSLNHHQDAEDLTQRVFIRVYRSSARYAPKAKFSTWIFTIARNLLIDEIKKRQRRPKIVSDELIENKKSMDSGGLEEWNEILLRRLDAIPENHKTALLLRVQRELSYKEIAKVMKTTESSVKTWIHRARLDLKSSLSSKDKIS
jgi:RNA polymerase sigma-70 factor (ECF subfamily)